MTTTSRILLYAKMAQIAYARVKASPAPGAPPLSITGYALRFVVRDKAGNLISAKTSASGAIAILDGVEDDGVTPTGGTDDMAATAFTADDLDTPPGADYQGALWRTDVGSEMALWEGPITIKRAADR